MEKQNIINKLRATLERTGYVSNVKIFQGEFHEDSRYNQNPMISYIINLRDNKKDTQLHKLEKEIREGFYDGHYLDCDIKTCIEEVSEDKERHTIIVNFNKQNNHQNKEKRLGKMAIHLRKIIE